MLGIYAPLGCPPDWQNGPKTGSQRTCDMRDTTHSRAFVTAVGAVATKTSTDGFLAVSAVHSNTMLPYNSFLESWVVKGKVTVNPAP